MDTLEPRRRPIWSGLAAAAIALAVTGVYLALIASQGLDPGERPRVVFFASAFAGAGLAAAGGSLHPSPEWSVCLLAAASSALFVLGALGIFSIGAPLLVASILATRATFVSGRRLPGRSGRLGAISAIVVFAALVAAMRAL